ncbi:MAG: hypothetical protein LIO46_06185, partial [Clostridiales bacterium]|nr:hypothetical protein [Clostridiales bacterium]
MKSARKQPFTRQLGGFILALFFALFPAAGVMADTGGVPRPATDETSLAQAIEAIETSGEIAIGSDIGLTGAIPIPAGKSIAIRSQGGPYTIYQEARSATVRHFRVEGSLTLQNITLDGRETGGGLSVSGGRAVLEEGAVLTNCRHYASGGAVSLLDGSALDIRGGEISFSATSSGGFSGGGIFAQDSKITMYSGMIRGNQSAWGGGVSLSQESTFVMEDGVISRNHATSESGGGVCVSTHAAFIMNGGFITDNEVDTKNAISRAGGGVFLGLGSHLST